MSFYGSGLLKGLGIVWKNFMRGPITVQYPREKVELPERARWAVQMKLTEEGEHKCTACLACERACPDFVIEIAVRSDEQRNKHIVRWHYELGACMMCGLCVEACPFDAIEMSHRYELARTDVATLTYDLLTDVPAASQKRKPAEPKSEDGSPGPGVPEALPETQMPTHPAAATEEAGDE